MRILLSDEDIYNVVADGGRAHESAAECKRWPTILHRNFNQSLRKKDLQCF